MATLTLTKVWVNLLDTGEAVSGWSDPERDQEHDVQGETRTYAGGRQRSVTQEGARGRFAFRLVAVSKTDVDTLNSWKSRTVQVRDHRGQLFVGTYFGVSVGEYMEPTLWSASIQLNLVTYTEGV